MQSSDVLLLPTCQTNLSVCRDVKPENLLLQRTDRFDQSAEQGMRGSPNPGTPLSTGDLRLRLIDFGSALDKHSTEGLYGAEGPSDDEQTAEYAPPEALLARCPHCFLPPCQCMSFGPSPPVCYLPEGRVSANTRAPISTLICTIIATCKICLVPQLIIGIACSVLSEPFQSASASLLVADRL